MAPEYELPDESFENLALLCLGNLGEFKPVIESHSLNGSVTVFEYQGEPVVIYSKGIFSKRKLRVSEKIAERFQNAGISLQETVQKEAH